MKTCILLAIVFILSACTTYDDHWSMVYEAIQTPEVPGGQKRFVLFNEDGLSKMQCKNLFDEHLRRLNNNAAIISYEIGCSNLMTKGHGTEFQAQINWLIP